MNKTHVKKRVVWYTFLLLLGSSSMCCQSKEDKPQASFQRDTGSIFSLSLSPNGKLLALSTRSQDEIRLWDVATWNEVAVVGGRFGHYSARFSPDGRILATASKDGAVHLWDLQNPKAHSTLTVGDGKTLEYWNVESKEGVVTLAFEQGDSGLPVFRSDGKMFVIPRRWGVEVWDFSRNPPKAIRRLTHGRCRARCLAFSPDGNTLAVGGEELGTDQQRSKIGVVQLWDVNVGKLLTSVDGYSDSVHSLAFSADGKMLATAGLRQTPVQLWNYAEDKLWLRVALDGHKAGSVATDVAFSPDGKMVATACSDATVRLWETSSGRLLKTLRGHGSQVNAIVFSKDGKQLFSADVGFDATLKVWKIPDDVLQK